MESRHSLTLRWKATSSSMRRARSPSSSARTPESISRPARLKSRRQTSSKWWSLGGGSDLGKERVGVGERCIGLLLDRFDGDLGVAVEHRLHPIGRNRALPRRPSGCVHLTPGHLSAPTIRLRTPRHACSSLRPRAGRGGGWRGSDPSASQAGIPGRDRSRAPLPEPAARDARSLLRPS
jgi:hypothetical protein